LFSRPPIECDRDLVEQWLIYAKTDLELAPVDLPSLLIAMIMIWLYNCQIAVFCGQKVLWMMKILTNIPDNQEI
jgi:hypothetical protein